MGGILGTTEPSMFKFGWEVPLGEAYTPLKFGDLDPIFKVNWYIFGTTDPSMFKFTWEVPLGEA